MISFKSNISSRSHTDTGLAYGTGFIALIVMVVLTLLLLFLAKESWPALRASGWMRFFRSDAWFPLSGELNVLPMLWATLMTSIGALLLAIPFGVVSAIFVRFYAPSYLRELVRQILALLAGIPSVVYGLWGLSVLVPLIAQWEPPGASLLAGILVLAIMILPTIALTTHSALNAIPTSHLLAAAGLGLTRKRTILSVALPSARRGIVTGVLLAAARAIGETMALLMVEGNVVQTPTSLFDPVRVLTTNIALEMAYATGDHRAALFASGLLLMSMVSFLAWIAAKGERRRCA